MAAEPAQAPTSSATGSVLLWQAGTSRPVADALREEALALLRGCTDRERRLVTEADWLAARSAGPALELHLQPPAVVDVGGRPGLRLTALLVAFTGPARVLARDGDVYYSAFTGCDATRLAALRTAAESSPDR